MTHKEKSNLIHEAGLEYQRKEKNVGHHWDLKGPKTDLAKKIARKRGIREDFFARLMVFTKSHTR